MNVPVKLAERPLRAENVDAAADEQPSPRRRELPWAWRSAISMTSCSRHLDLPSGVHGVVVARVDPAGAAFEADIQRGHVLMEINRQPVRSVGDFQRLVAAAKSGDVLTLYIFNPGSGRALHTLKID